MLFGNFLHWSSLYNILGEKNVWQLRSINFCPDTSFEWSHDPIDCKLQLYNLICGCVEKVKEQAWIDWFIILYFFIFHLFIGKTIEINRSLAVASSKLICRLLKASENETQDCHLFFTAISETPLRVFSEVVYTGCYQIVNICYKISRNAFSFVNICCRISRIALLPLILIHEDAQKIKK